MIGDIGNWNYGLLFAALIVVLGISGIVSSQVIKKQLQASGMVLQGIILMFVAGISFFPRSIELRLGGLTLVMLLLIQTLVVTNPGAKENLREENQSK